VTFTTSLKQTKKTSRLLRLFKKKPHWQISNVSMSSREFPSPAA